MNLSKMLFKFGIISLVITYGGCSDKTKEEQNVVAKPKEVQKEQKLLFTFPDSNNTFCII